MGTVSFSQIPTTLKTPGVYTEISNEAAGIYVENNRTLIIGQAIGAVSDETPKLVPNVDWVAQTYGAGSILDVMCRRFRDNNQFGELWILPLADAAASTKATATITITGTATAGGTLNLYVGGEIIQVPVANGQTATQIASAIVTYIGLNSQLPITATSALGVVTCTAKNAGTLGNSLKLFVNYRGTEEGEYLPNGVSNIAVTAFTGGATDPTLSAKLVGVGNQEVAYYVHPYADTNSLNAMRDFLQLRWDALGGNKDGVAFTAIAGTFSALQTLGSGRNDENHLICGYESTHPVWAPSMVAAYGGVASFHLNQDPARGLQNLVLRGIPAIKENDRFTFTNRETLLDTGIATLKYTNDGRTQIQRAITTHQTNLNGQPDDSYLDIMTRTSLNYIRRAVTAYMGRFSRHKLATSESAFGEGRSVVTPRTLRSELIVWYDRMVAAGVAQNPGYFASHTRVYVDQNDPNRVNIELAPMLMNNLMVTAMLISFRLKT